MAFETIDIIIAVTQEDIKQGIKKDPEFCPIAQSIRRDFRPKRVYVGNQPFIITEQNKHYDIFLTWEMLHFMQNFDRGFSVYPSAFRTKIIPIGEGEGQ